MILRSYLSNSVDKKEKYEEKKKLKEKGYLSNSVDKKV